MTQSDDVQRGTIDRLQALAGSAVPVIPVRTDGVVRRARRRRVGTVVGASLAVLVVASGTAAAVGTLAAPAAAPVGPAAQPADPTTSAASPGPSAVPTAQSSAGPDLTLVAGDPWPGDEPYWYVEIAYSYDGESSTDQVWASRERPGVQVRDGDLGSAFAFGPRSVLGSFDDQDGELVRVSNTDGMPRDVAQLDALVRRMTAGHGSGTADQEVFVQVQAALHDGGLLPRDLRDAYWGVVAALPGAVVDTATDDAGRAGERVSFELPFGTASMIRDPETGLLQESTADGAQYLFVEQHAAGDIPVEPTLEMAGCAQWSAC